MVIKALNMKCSFTLFSPLWLLISFILLDSSYVLEASDGMKEKCTMCKDIVKNFHEVCFNFVLIIDELSIDK